ncbi:MAG: hypothetical protein KAR38_10715 [Calditrichia bacterium]|nr:hypothetical protein [Calditrichia bacterium]
MKFITLILITFSIVLFNCAEKIQKNAKIVAEYEIVEIPLQGKAAGKRSEISGLAWYKNYLILLPQYPDRFANHFFAIPKNQIEAFLDKKSTNPIIPVKIPVNTNGLENKIPGYEGFEALIFKGDTVFFTIESETDKEKKAYIAMGLVKNELEEISIFSEPLPAVISKSQANNMSEETIVIVNNKIMTIHEANGKNVNPQPQGSLFSFTLQAKNSIPFPAIEYRITDATEADSLNRFWAINFNYPGEKKHLKPVEDSLILKFGVGKTHAQTSIVERLIEFQYKGGKIIFTEQPPVQLKLNVNKESRNWEGIVRLDNRGFILVTDRFPRTVLAFVSYHK